MRHFKSFFFVIYIIRKLTTKTEKLQLRGNKLMRAEAFQLLRGHAPAQLRGNIDSQSKNFLVFVVKVPDFKM
jgi:hypothetical protein